MTAKKRKNKVLFLDSGIGGLTQMKLASQNYPNLDYIYFADFLGSPYGNLNPTELRERLFKLLSRLTTKLRVNIVVIACNTATSVAIKFLRIRLPKITFIGTEPAVFLAKKQGFMRPLVLATPNTIKHNQSLKRISLNWGVSLKTLAMSSLPKIIERNIDNLDYPTKKVLNEIKFYKDYDCIILGCTHFTYLKRNLSSTLAVPILDGNEGVVTRLASFIEEGKKGRVRLLSNDHKKLDYLQKIWENF